MEVVVVSILATFWYNYVLNMKSLPVLYLKGTKGFESKAFHVMRHKNRRALLHHKFGRNKFMVHE